jgi:hypothetical protein
VRVTVGGGGKGGGRVDEGKEVCVEGKGEVGFLYKIL